MARIQLRDCTIQLQDGLSGTAAVNQPSTAPVTGDATIAINSIALQHAESRKGSGGCALHDRG